jgi:hypothetical protein
MPRAKAQSAPSSEKYFLPLRPWRLGAINFLEAVLFNFSKARI